MKEKGKCTVTRISGADGPTSVWVAGKTKDKNFLRRMRNAGRQRKYKKKREQIIKKLNQNIEILDETAHTLDEVCAYVIEKYGAREVGADEKWYQTKQKECRQALVQRYRPDLLGEPPKKLCRENLDDAEAVERHIEESRKYLEREENIPQDVFPMDYHYFTITVEGIGEVQVDIEKRYQLFGVGYSAGKGKQKAVERIRKDLYSFYGVTKADVENGTERANAYIATLVH